MEKLLQDVTITPNIQKNTFQESKEILSQKQACEFYDISEPTLRKFIKEGLIMQYQYPLIKKVFYLRSQIDTMLLQCAEIQAYERNSNRKNSQLKKVQ